MRPQTLLVAEYMPTLVHVLRRNTSTRTGSAIGMSSQRTASSTGTVRDPSNPLPLTKHIIC